MGKIVILDENTANQIAAGEVIERPASIVKEMVENALDANATAITVDIVNGGIKSIRITDNGDGIETDDVEMAFERYATSKIRGIDDLNRLSTMGFRGEALASIASVAKVEVVTKTEEAVDGIKVVIESGSILLAQPAGAPKGTTFTVRELFYNTPARYKFLKKDTTEAGYVQELLTRIALARPDVSIKLISQGKTLMHTPGNHDLLSVIYSIYGKEIARSVIPIKTSGEGLEVTGFAGKPEIARGNRSFQSILVNGRFIYNRIITAAIEEAYKTRLMQKRFPFAVLKLSISPQFVDVNVHPSKLEVRFSDEQKVFRAVYHAVLEALSENSSIPEVVGTAGRQQISDKTASQGSELRNVLYSKSMPFNTATPLSSQKQGNIMAESRSENHTPEPKSENRTNKPSSGNCINELKPENSINELKLENNINEPKSENHRTEPNPTEISAGRPNPAAFNPDGFYQAVTTTQQMGVFQPITIYETEKQVMNYLGKKDTCGGQAGMETKQETPLLTETDTKQEFPTPEGKETKQETLMPAGTGTEIKQETSILVKDREKLLMARIIGQAFESFILLEVGEEVLLIDQHAAHERIRFEKIKKQFMLKESFSQGLLSPLAVNLSALEIHKFHELSEHLENLGFEAEDFGNRSILIRAIPYILDSSFSGQDFLDILEKLSQEAPSVSEIIPEETLYMMACKSAIKANRTMSPMEIKGLVQELANAENPYTCVHGRPVIISMGKRELEKRFKRIV